MSQGVVLIVEDEAALAEAIKETLALANLPSVIANHAEEALEKIKRHNILIVISDINMPGISGHELLKQIKRYQSDIPVLLMTAFSNIESAVQAMRDGAADYIAKPFEPEYLVECVQNFINKKIYDEKNPIAEDLNTKKLFSLAKKVAATDASVLITGESGTGKEVLSRFIHHHSSRYKNSFIAINCAAIPENMLEAVLFGYEKGAFTGAYQACPGKFEQANGGTLLLDEISEMDLNLQAKLLRVLQEKEVERLGGRKLIQLDVRIIATSNRKIQDYIKDGRFREDLYYRINVFPLQWQPLRSRINDIVPLAKRLVYQYANKEKVPELTQAAEEKLTEYFWPGNIRELDNVMQRAIILHVGDKIEIDDIQLDSDWQSDEYDESQINNINNNFKNKGEENIDDINGNDSNNENGNGKSDNLSYEMKCHEFDIILKSLEKHKGVRKKVSEELDISSRTLRYKLAKMREAGITIPGVQIEKAEE
ncbi:Fis family transcriptional regulator [Piscirickettsia salmonis]|uniref:Nitrogen assimilation regulatory protein n=1 Tax=Piscirickettsia salmonis TaxID=1238 RepID=A0A9Q5VM56_PISSA|nr:sigma-54 dependent transcriptional regulator [Piscirickettsia salmonis]ALA26143.1 bacterial regulatory, Fis family protein [Piscirickettsia salmonis]APS43588.1 Fis family transcriptional regulator [Piscirickettsia salmonis]APS46942.1 Fis family transcriptional regulator [Piscirickettsia salmonis]APS54823.1 Fis family transcriptional regulator [Piscirickettsia salmonis]APS57933.1 Fis family transcriptional regulator [Piscirickettsia salmonis]